MRSSSGDQEERRNGDAIPLSSALTAVDRDGAQLLVYLERDPSGQGVQFRLPCGALIQLIRATFDTAVMLMNAHHKQITEQASAPSPEIDEAHGGGIVLMFPVRS